MLVWPFLVLLGCAGGEAAPRTTSDGVLLAVSPEPMAVLNELSSSEPVSLRIVSSPEVAFLVDLDGIADPDDGETDPPPPVPEPVPSPPSEPAPVPEPAPPLVPVSEPVPTPVSEPTPVPVSLPEPTPPPVFVPKADTLQQQTQVVQTQAAQQEQQVDQINDELLVIINKLRAEKGLPPLLPGPIVPEAFADPALPQ